MIMQAIKEAIFGGRGAAKIAGKSMMESWSPAKTALGGGRGLYGMGRDIHGRGGKIIEKNSPYLSGMIDRGESARNIKMSTLQSAYNTRTSSAGKRDRNEFFSVMAGRSASKAEGGVGAGFASGGKLIGEQGRPLARSEARGMAAHWNNMTVDEANEGFAGFSEVSARYHDRAPIHRARKHTAREFSPAISTRMAGTHDLNVRRGLFQSGGMLSNMFDGVKSLARGFNSKRGGGRR